MIVIGVTGGMASGKSTVARMFAGRGVHHVDADKLVHILMRHDKPTIAALADAFPQAVTDNAVDRAALAALIAREPTHLVTLEKILHPRVRALEEKRITRARRARARAIILDIPLLFETDAYRLCDEIITVIAPLAQRRRRAFKRPGMTPEKWQKLLDRQLPDHRRAMLADHIITTGTGKAATHRQVRALKKAWGLI